ncbi:MAG: 2-phospho-L-lactate transferase [Chloroflexota bacterium]|jgi:LPPG:FO 2-phospho-L-lactate transferase|nr:2-phospho-L-lactate transferase [Chloroflexota bacterium]
MGDPIRVTVLAGGFGGARMAHGFELLGERVALSVIVNTADDLELHGLLVSPDLDTVMYTLSGEANDATGWGVRDETWSAAEMLERYGAPTWFKLGDRDLATHILRTAAVRGGGRLTDVEARLASALGVRAKLLPMSDSAIRTSVRIADGWLDFQDYFVRRHHADEALELRFSGAGDARPTPEVARAIGTADLIVIAPSNPFVSVGPILAVPGLLTLLLNAAAPVVAVSPIVGGAAVRGPAAEMMLSLGKQPGTAAGVAAYYHAAYRGLIDILAIDSVDAAESDAIARTGMRPIVTNTLIAAPDARRALAEELLALARQLAHR